MGERRNHIQNTITVTFMVTVRVTVRVTITVYGLRFTFTVRGTVTRRGGNSIKS